VKDDNLRVTAVHVHINMGVGQSLHKSNGDNFSRAKKTVRPGDREQELNKLEKIQWDMN
jgi:hypothetical protein